MTEIYDKDNNLISEMYDEDGNPVEEIATPEEVEQKVKDAQEETKANFQVDKEDLEEKLSNKEDELKQTQEDLQKAGNKDQNFNKLRKNKEEKESELSELKEQMTKLGEKIDQQGSASTERRTGDSINKLANNDKDLSDKIKFHYDQFVTPSDDNPEKQQERLKNAYTLAIGSQTASALSSTAIGSGSGGFQPKPAGNTGKISPEAIEVAKELGLDEKTLRRNKLI